MKPLTLLPYVLEALRRFWFVVLVTFALGIILAVVAYADGIPPFISYQATSVLGIAPVSAPGVTPACSANGIPTLVRSPDAVGSAATKIATITAAVQTATLVNIVGTAGTLENARTGSNDAVTSIAAYCNARIQAAFQAQVGSLAKQLATQRTALAGLDQTTLGAQATSTNAAALEKQIADLVAKQQALQDKYTALAIAASTAQTGLAATVPVAYNEINLANPRYVALQKQTDADAQLYDSVASHYRAKAPRVIDLAARLATDQQGLADIRADLDVAANLMLSTAYAKAYAAQQSAQSDAQATSAQVDLYTQRIAALEAKLPKSNPTTPAVLDAQRQSTTAKATYAALATNLAKVNAEQAALGANPAVVVAGESTDDTVAVHGRLAALIFSLALAVVFLLLGVLLAIVIFALDDRLVTTKQITKLYAKPVIATLAPK